MKKYLLAAVVLVLGFTNVFAQMQKIKNQPYGDQKLYHFGITVGMNFQDIDITNSGMQTDGETWFATIPNYSPGFSVGLLADYYLNHFLNLRVTPTLHFGDKNFQFIEQETGKIHKASIRSNYLHIPVDLKVRSLRLNNYRPYFLVGAYAGLDLGRQTDKVVYLKAMDYGINIGIGCDFYMPIIKVVPELRFSFGLGNIIETKRTDLTDMSLLKYSNSVSRGKTRMISIVFNFE
ncbi:hypothetical protein M2138_001246 [Dysgonomonadaceae bacterium PH5-43]|nr:hypothetical protein [Dysgonomonadaceae bacterium PH5-43]